MTQIIGLQFVAIVEIGIFDMKHYIQYTYASVDYNYKAIMTARGITIHVRK
jgi:hypothetical protein